MDTMKSLMKTAEMSNKMAEEGARRVVELMRENRTLRERLAEYEAALTSIRDVLPLENDVYARRVFTIAANALEPEGTSAVER